LSADSSERRAVLAHVGEWFALGQDGAQVTVAEFKPSEGGVRQAAVEAGDQVVGDRLNGRREEDENGADLWRGPDDQLLDARDAAVLLTVKPSTLLSWAREGRVPVVRLGPRHLRWTRPLLRQIRDAALDPGRRI
jgi:hypothetical protein